MQFNNPAPSSSVAHVDLNKKDLIGDLVIVSLTSYQPELETSYGSTTASFLTLHVVDGDHAGTVIEDWAAFGVLGQQIGQLEVGENGLGRITSGESANGRSYFGFNFTSDAADIAAAEKSIATVATQTPEVAPF